MSTQPMGFPSNAVGVTVITTGVAQTNEIAQARSGAPAMLHNRSAVDGEDIYFNLGDADVETSDEDSKSISPGAYLPITLLDGQSHINTTAATGTPKLEIAVGVSGA